MIYPDNQETMLAKGITDEDLENILDIVHLKYIVKREGGRHDCRLALGISSLACYLLLPAHW